MFVIMRRGVFLCEGSKSRGSQAGIGRTWSEDMDFDAKRFDTEAAAEAFLLADDFDQYERKGLVILKVAR